LTILLAIMLLFVGALIGAWAWRAQREPPSRPA
jgi:hypothetical protein